MSLATADEQDAAVRRVLLQVSEARSLAEFNSSGGPRTVDLTGSVSFVGGASSILVGSRRE
jgi:hypothetical protein